MGTATLTKEKTNLETQKSTSSQRNVILFNDEVNTFDFVIECLMEICAHELLQAEQCTYLVHFTGKCAVKSGDYSELKPVCEALLEKGLTAEIN